jgi:hypothetical protein
VNHESIAKHNPTAQAIASIKNEIVRADRFIASMLQG